MDEALQFLSGDDTDTSNACQCAQAHTPQCECQGIPEETFPTGFEELNKGEELIDENEIPF